MRIDDITQASLLYDFYGQLLPKRQREVIALYHEENLTLSEIAGEFQISRQGVHDALKNAEKALDEYESKLGLVAKFEKSQEAIGEIDGIIDGVIARLQSGGSFMAETAGNAMGICGKAAESANQTGTLDKAAESAGQTETPDKVAGKPASETAASLHPAAKPGAGVSPAPLSDSKAAAVRSDPAAQGATITSSSSVAAQDLTADPVREKPVYQSIALPDTLKTVIRELKQVKEIIDNLEE